MTLVGAYFIRRRGRGGHPHVHRITLDDSSEKGTASIALSEMASFRDKWRSSATSSTMVRAATLVSSGRPGQETQDRASYRNSNGRVSPFLLPAGPYIPASNPKTSKGQPPLPPSSPAEPNPASQSNYEASTNPSPSTSGSAHLERPTKSRKKDVDTLRSMIQRGATDSELAAAIRTNPGHGAQQTGRIVSSSTTVLGRGASLPPPRYTLTRP